MKSTCEYEFTPKSSLTKYIREFCFPKNVNLYTFQIYFRAYICTNVVGVDCISNYLYDFDFWKKWK